MDSILKEYIRKRNEARQGLSKEQIKARTGLSQDQIDALDLEEENRRKVSNLARKIHVARFPEEYDFMYDSNWDLHDRKNGKNPMSQEYIDEITKKRADLGVSQLSESGMPVSSDTMELCIEEAKKIIYGH